MTALLRIALKSAWNRRLTLGLTVAAIALATTLLLGVERTRLAAREGFASSVSGTDLIVGARASPVQLLLAAVFRVGEPAAEMSWRSYEAIAGHPAVAWVLPLTFGDSHRGFPVLGSLPAYFERFRYGVGTGLRMSAGRAFSGDLDGLYEAVLGAEVAGRLGYGIGEAIVLAHGAGGELAHGEHADKPFRVVGILARTGTPVDRTVHVSLGAIEAIHLDWAGGAPLPGVSIPPQFARKFDLAPKRISAMLVGLKDRSAALRVQRFVNDFGAEALTGVLPGVALDELWQVVGVVERTLRALSALVVAVGLAGLAAVVLAGLDARRRELAILRSVGAGPRHIVVLLAAEGLLVTLTGAAAGLVSLSAGALFLGPAIEARYGLALALQMPGGGEWRLLGAVLATGIAAAVLPGWRAYRLSLADGLTPRL
ncbi:MAG: ABC transporter permease [Rhodocyclaceae bacterium]